MTEPTPTVTAGSALPEPLDGSALPMDPQLLKLLLDRVPARVVLIDREHRYVYANHETLDFLGLRAEQIIGHTVQQVRGDGVFQRYLPVVSQLLAGQTVHWQGWTDYPHRGRSRCTAHARRSPSP